MSGGVIVYVICIKVVQTEADRMGGILQFRKMWYSSSDNHGGWK